MSFPITEVHEENKRKIGQERSSMQQADYQCHRPTPWMQESVSMNARKCVHECNKVCPWMQESVSMNAIKCVHECKKVCPWMQESVSMNARKCVHECKKVCPWMQESVSMNARKCVHECKKVCPCTKALPQSGIRAWIKQGRRKRDRKDRGQEVDGKKGKTKHIWGTKTRPA